MSRPALVLNPKRKNYYLPEDLSSKAAKIARLRYGISGSELVARLMVKELKHPKGLCHVRPRELCPIR